MATIDLHTHSYYSDGALSPEQLVQRAWDCGVKMMALTDHDSTAGLSEAHAVGQRLGVHIIDGLELSTQWQKLNVHVLGLHLQVEHPGLKILLSQQAAARGERARRMAERFEQLGIRGVYDQALALAESPDTLSRQHFAQVLLARGVVHSLQQAFDRYLGDGKKAAVPMPWVTMEEGIAVLLQAGATVVLAHPLRYGMTLTRLLKLLQAFAAAGGQAVEMATATQDAAMIPWLVRQADTLGLKSSQGSDYHGPHMPWVELGQFADMPPSCRPVWSDWP